ncbi:MAG: DeoR family transcriptional regulator [Firmicutes bacterium HGW-Firmicutes-12]|jgi:central glycolytic genes regulator|nr:MAG: DeoR family transcriptional regulator [Firmicutes bacterium HGW-Firmicutes-12]
MAKGGLIVNETVRLLSKFTPEIIDLLERRYNILRAIKNGQPLGRRLLAEQLSLGERVVRGELDFLKNQQLLVSNTAGVSLTLECESLMLQLGELVHKLRGLITLERNLTQKLGLEKVYIVPGDVDNDRSILHEIGKMGARFIRDVVKDDWVVAVTGGTTMAEVAYSFPKSAGKKNVLIVPARGGLGEDVDIQANTIAAGIAQRLGVSYRLLHVPDGISEETLDKLMLENRVQEVITLSRHANLLVHGIGNPMETAKRRDLNWPKLFEGTNKSAVGEVFGYFFAADGSIVKTTPTVGPTLEELAELDLVVAVAGGRGKAEAILAVLKHGFVDILFTDQGAGERIQELLEI